MKEKIFSMLTPTTLNFTTQLSLNVTIIEEEAWNNFTQNMATKQEEFRNLSQMARVNIQIMKEILEEKKRVYQK